MGEFPSIQYNINCFASMTVALNLQERLEQLLEQVVRGYEKNEAGISRASDLNLATLDRHTMASWCAFHSVRLQSLLWRVD